VNRTSAVFRHSIDAVLLAGLSLGAFYATARIGLQPRDPASGVAVVFAPWTAPDAALLRSVGAGGRFVRFGGLPFIAVVIPADSNYSSRILAAGAWLVVDPQAVAACLSTSASAAQSP
jgi:hypothetical protein